MSREIKFRVWDVQKHKMYYLESTDENHNHYLQTGSGGFWLYSSADGKLICNYRSGDLLQFTGLKDKNGKMVYEGDILRWYTLDIEYQTHTGDNIPMGSYTEPCGMICRKYEKPVLFRDGMFTCAVAHDPEEEEYPNCECPIHYGHPYDRKELNQIFYPRPYGREHEVLTDEEFLEVAQSISEELGFECASIDDFIQKLNGFEVICNIFENAEIISTTLNNKK